MRTLGLAGLLVALVAGMGSASAGAARTMYVVNFNSQGSNAGSLETFPVGANGNVAPTTAIAGAQTGLRNPEHVAADAAGEVFTVIGAQFNQTAIAVYAPGATGNVAPTRTIVDGIGTHFIFNVAVDPAGDTYAMYQTSDERADGIDVFASGASGTVQPIRTIAGGKALLSPMSTVVELYVDEHGDVWWYGDGEVGPQRIVEYAPGAKGNAVPVRVIEGRRALAPSVQGFAVDAQGEVFAGGSIFIPGCRRCAPKAGQTIAVFGPGQSGNVAPARRLRVDCTSCTPTATADRDIFFISTLGSSGSAIEVYDAFGHGLQHPLATISGSNTGLDNPLFVWVR